MSAQALLSVIAPVAPLPSKGAAGVDASGFEGLLAAMLGAEAAGKGEGADTEVQGVEPRTDQTASGFLVSPLVLPPQPTAKAIAESPAAEGDAVVAAEPATIPPLTVAPVDTDEGAGSDDLVQSETSATELSADAAAPMTADLAAPVPAPTVAVASPAPAAPAPESSTAAAPAAPVAATPAEALPVAPAPSDDEPAISEAAAKTPAVEPEVRPAEPTGPAVVQPEVSRPQPVKADRTAGLVQTPPPAPSVTQDDVALAVAAEVVQAAEQVKTADAAATDASSTPTPPPPPARPTPDQIERPSNASRGKSAASRDDNSARTISGETRPAGIDAASSRPSIEQARMETPVEAPAPVAAAMPEPAQPEAAPQGAAPAEPLVLPGEPAAVDKPILSRISQVALEATAQIAAQIVRKLEGRSTTFEMALTPDELGRVDVRLEIDSDGRLTARLAFDNPLAATDLRGRADDLRRQLEQAGFQLADNALEFADRDSSSSAFDRGDDGRGHGRAFANAARLNAEADAAAPPPRWVSLSLSPLGVDLKV